jgi:anti-sigma B factor antagonist
MKYDIKNKDNTYLVTIGGELDVYNVPSLSEKIKSIVDNNLAKTVVFNLTNVIYIDSSGLGLFMATLKMLNKINGKMFLVGLKKEIKKIFELTQIIDFFNIYETVDEFNKKEKINLNEI